MILAANLMAMLIQNLSAKIGIATGKNLPELCREHFSRPVTWGLWVQAELIAMATDLAEFVGAAIALNLLFGVPLFPAGLITAVVAFGDPRRSRAADTGASSSRSSSSSASSCSGSSTTRCGSEPTPPAWRAASCRGSTGSDSILLATGILGATVMPHVIYLHSALTQRRVPTENANERRKLLRFTRIDVMIAMGLAGLVNMSMLIIAASLFHGTSLDVDSIEKAHAGFSSLVGPEAALAFALALLASGLASSSVGTYAGQVVMQGFIQRRIPLVMRRLVTMIPALIVLAIGLDPTRSLVISQVVLSFGIPFALVPLVLLTRRRDVMGDLANHRVTTLVAAVVAALISALNIFLLYQTFFG